MDKRIPPIRSPKISKSKNVFFLRFITSSLYRDWFVISAQLSDGGGRTPSWPQATSHQGFSGSTLTVSASYIWPYAMISHAVTFSNTCSYITTCSTFTWFSRSGPKFYKTRLNYRYWICFRVGFSHVTFIFRT